SRTDGHRLADERAGAQVRAAADPYPTAEAYPGGDGRVVLDHAVVGEHGVRHHLDVRADGHLGGEDDLGQQYRSRPDDAARADRHARVHDRGVALRGQPQPFNDPGTSRVVARVTDTHDDRRVPQSVHSGQWTEDRYSPALGPVQRRVVVEEAEQPPGRTV